MINKVTLIGNLGSDPEIRHFEGGGKVTKFSLATNENYQDRQGNWQTQTEWHNIVLWGASAERAEKQLNKGMLVYCEGKISYRKWQDKEGNDRYNTDIRANTYRILEKRESGAAGLPDAGMPSIEDRFQTATPTAPKVEGTKPPFEDDLPF
ncbi:MAG: single-strand DNA-binding protein [Saprospiraceae bacterium]|jgi:single-strand DNA-binding protein